MKKLSFFNRLIFLLNCLFAVLLLLSYTLPYISPSAFPRLSLLSLVLPVLLLINLGFFVYWLLGLKRQFLVSGLILLLGMNHITGIYNLGKETRAASQNLSVLSYNVRAFSVNGLDQKDDTQVKIYKFIKEQNPTIVCLQEYSAIAGTPGLAYPYQVKAMKRFKSSFGQIIYSQYPIINSGSFDFKKTSNNIMYADVVIEQDTVRVYNIHLQSFKVSSQFVELQQADSKKLIGRMVTAFEKQENQVKAFLENEAASPYPVIIAGDFNNSSTSYVYRKLKGKKNDAFAKAGTGTGRTFTFDFLPLRIDFVLTDPRFKITNFKNYSLSLSDHEPIKASFMMEK